MKVIEMVGLYGCFLFGIINFILMYGFGFNLFNMDFVKFEIFKYEGILY